MDKAAVVEASAPIAEKLQSVDAVVVDKVADLPADLRQAVIEGGGQASHGFYDVKEDKVYLIANNIDSVDRAIKVLLHEGVGHKGLRYLLGADFEDTMHSVFSNSESSGILGEITRKYGLDPSNAKDRITAAEEFISYFAESNISSDILQTIIAQVRRILRSLGIVKVWSDDDIRLLLRRSRSNMRGKPLANIEIKSEVEVDGEVYEIGEPADVVLRRIEKRENMLKKLRECVK